MAFIVIVIIAYFAIIAFIIKANIKAFSFFPALKRSQFLKK